MKEQLLSDPDQNWPEGPAAVSGDGSVLTGAGRRAPRRRWGGLNAADRADWVRALVVAVSVFSLCASAFGVAIVVVLIACCAYLTYDSFRRARGMLLSSIVFLAYPLFQVLSTLWSLAPDITLRYSIQLFMTGLLGVAAGLVCAPSRLVVSVTAGAGAAVILSVILGTQGPSAEGMVLVGIAGSKDNMSLMGQLTFQGALAMLFLSNVPRSLKLLVIPVGLLGGYVAVSVHAATGVITLAIGLALFPVLVLMSRTTSAIRILMLFVVGICIIGAAVYWNDLSDAFAEFSLRVLHKDRTLTGRTVLWDFAKTFASERPWLGRGYKEIWLGSSADTIGLLRWAGIEDGRQFYFHQTYLDALVDSGYVGVGVLVCSFIGIGVQYLVALVRGAGPALMFFMTMFALLMLRAFGETLMQPFSVYLCVLFMGVSSCAKALHARAMAAPRRTRRAA